MSNVVSCEKSRSTDPTELHFHDQFHPNWTVRPNPDGRMNRKPEDKFMTERLKSRK